MNASNDTDDSGKKENPMDILAQLIRGKKSTAKMDEHVHEAVTLSNKLFYQTILARYGSWEGFVEAQRKRSERDK